MQKLLSPITINNVTFKNRIVMPAMHHLYTPDGLISERFKKYYYERAKGGAGLIIIGGAKFEEYGAAPMMPDITHPNFINDFKDFTTTMHEYGAKVGIQLYHAGRYAMGSKKLLSPSSVYSHFSRATPSEMSLEDIDYAVNAWIDGARKIKDAGFDVIEILASAGYLISQFLSPLTNKRTDEYGGNLENRLRFAKRVITGVKKEVGNDVLISVRVAGNDFVSGSNTSDEAVIFAKHYEKWGADFLNVTGGWHETTIPQLPGEVPHGAFTYLANKIKKAVSIPVLASNRFNLPEFAEEALALEVADLIGFARPLLADPYLPQKLYEGKHNTICFCIGCNQGCLARTFFNRPIECTVNPFAGYEYELELEKTNKPKNILVVGGGPVGAQAAIILSKRGHSVSLWEKNNKLGGQIDVASAPLGKEDFKLLGFYQEETLKESNVNVSLNKKATKEEILKYNFDEIILATGSLPIIPTLKKDDSSVEFLSAEDVLLNKKVPGKNVAIIGGGTVGTEVASYLLNKSTISKDLLYFLMTHKAETPEKIDALLNESKRNISIIETKKRIGEGFDLGCGWPVLKQIKRLNANVYTSSKAIEVKNNELIILDSDNNEKTIAVDTIVFAVGYYSNNTLEKELESFKDIVHVIGDATAPSKILDGIASATRLALKL